VALKHYPHTETTEGARENSGIGRASKYRGYLLKTWIVGLTGIFDGFVRWGET